MPNSLEQIIIIPIYRNELSEFERISLRQAGKVLGRYSFAFVTSKNVDTRVHEEVLREYQVVPRKCLFAAASFGSIGAYNRLLIGKRFYQEFKRHKYMLILQLDAFVFRDELQSWCEKDYDYIGAPWIEGMHAASLYGQYVGVGNGGFSLRKIDSSLRALKSLSYLERPGGVFGMFRRDFRIKPFRSFAGLIKRLTVVNNSFSVFNDFGYNEDDFWGRLMPRNFKWFKVPEPREALKFSMEVCPRKMFDDNDRKLPFGCHAWWKYDIDFWKPYIEAEGHDVGGDTEESYGDRKMNGSPAV